MRKANGRSRWLLQAVIAMLIGLASAAQVQARQDAGDLPPDYQPIAENETFELLLDANTLAFQVRDKRSDYVWRSGLDVIEEGDRLNNSWQAFARSGISIEYLDDRGVNRRVSLTNSDHTLEVTPIENGVSAQVAFSEYGIGLELRLTLEEDGLRVEVPFESIREDMPEAFRLGRIFLYPFLGAARGSTEDGYMLLPDGSGSLIRFGDTTRADNMYIERYYGDDLGMIGEEPYDPFVYTPAAMSLPVYGIAHSDAQGAILTVIEEGASYGELQAHPAGIITNFNFLYNAFLYNEPYFQATNRAGAGVTTVQDEPNAFNIVQHYRFLTGDDADYVGMALDYQQYLVEHGQLTEHPVDNPDIPIRLEFLGGDHEPVLLWTRFVPMTTIAQMNDILAQLALPNPDVVYYGWQPNGATSVPPTSVQVDGSLGSLSDLQALANQIAEDGGHFSLYYDPVSALRDQPGYSTRTDLAMSIKNDLLESYTHYPTYFFSNAQTSQRFSAFAADAAAQLNAGLSLDAIGYRLFSDFRDDPATTREQAIASYQQTLTTATQRLALYYPFDYLLGEADAYYDIPLRSNGYIFTSEDVPFLPIVLSGYMPYYGRGLNFSSNMQEDLLRHAEYGVYPSYFLTQEPTADMLNTGSAWIYTSSIEQWGGPIREAYAWLNALLAPVRGQRIVDHAQLAAGVAMTTYADGQRIVVNYADQPFTVDGVTVNARDAALLEAA